MPAEPTDEQQRGDAPYPNSLREAREQAMFSRAQLIRLCAKLQVQDDIKYVNISMTTLHGLEAGTRRPRRSTAATVADALGLSVEMLFPKGFDDPVRNPEGNTRIAPDRPAPGRPRLHKKG